MLQRFLSDGLYTLVDNLIELFGRCLHGALQVQLVLLLDHADEQKCERLNEIDDV